MGSACVRVIKRDVVDKNENSKNENEIKNDSNKINNVLKNKESIQKIHVDEIKKDNEKRLSINEKKLSINEKRKIIDEKRKSVDEKRKIIDEKIISIRDEKVINPDGRSESFHKKKKIIILNGGPGSGKNIQGNLILKHFNFKQIVISDLLKNYIKIHTKENEDASIINENDEIEKEKIETISIINKSLHEGFFVPDKIVIKLFLAELNNLLNEDIEGILINGYPRTHEQALVFKEHNINVNLFINIIVSKETLLNRIKNRLIDPVTNSSYVENIVELVKKKRRGEELNEEEKEKIEHDEPNLTDEIIGRLVKRTDDIEDTFNKRFNLYEENTNQFIEVFKDIRKDLDGEKTIHDIFEEIKKIIDEIKM